MRVVVAPDCFTGTLTAVEAAAAIASGWLAQAPDDEVVQLPLADGGPGFVDALASGVGGRMVQAVVSGPTGAAVTAGVLLVPGEADPSGRRSAYVESALACGLHLIDPAERDPAAMTSHGVGELLALAVESGAERIVVGLGGSGTNDGGSGLLAALGGLDAALRRLAGAELVVASDVDSPLLGPHGASLGFARQKGAAPETLPVLEEGMRAWADVLVEQAREAGVSRPERLVSAPGAGAAGGIGFALLALGAGREPGAQVVADVVGLTGEALAADLLVTGEGSFDWQSLRGKVVTAVARAGQHTGRPVVVVAGQVLVGRRELATAGIDAAYAVVSGPVTLDDALADPAGTLAARASSVAATWSPRPRGQHRPAP